MTRLVLCLLTIGLWLSSAADLLGQSSSDVPRDLNLLRVPASERSAWPSGEWHEVPRDLLDEYLRHIRLHPTALRAPIERPLSGSYSGRIEGARLFGTCRLTCSSKPARAREVLLSPLNLNLENVESLQGAAVWGARPDGETVLIADADATQWEAQWSVAGRRVFDDIEFALEVPLARANTLTLLLPADLALICTHGVVEGPLTTDDPGLNQWIVHAGRHTQLTLICTPRKLHDRSGPSLVRESHFVTLQGDGLDVLSDFAFVSSQPQSLKFDLPEELGVVSVTTAPDAHIPFQIADVGPSKTLVVQLPSSKRIRQMRLRVRCFGTAARTRSELTRVPLPRMVDADAVNRQVNVVVQPPLLLSRYSADGYQLTDRRVDSQKAEVWSFEALQRTGRLALAVESPVAHPDVHISTLADFRSDIAALRSRVKIVGRGGPTLQFDALLPPEWSVVDVTTFRGDPGTVIAGYSVTPDADSSWQRLAIDFRNAVQADDELDLLVTAVRSAPQPSESLPSPTLCPIGLTSHDGLLAVVPPQNMEIAGNLTPVGSHVDSRGFQRLSELATEGELREAQFFDAGDAVPTVLSCELTFESAIGRLPLTAPDDHPVEDHPLSESESRALPAAHSKPGPLLNLLRLDTYLAPADAGYHVHEAEFLLGSGFTGPAEFELTSECTHVELRVDGEPVPLLRRDSRWVSVSSVNAQTSLAVRYQTVAERGRWTEVESAAVPHWVGAAMPLEWSIHPVDSRACDRVHAPFCRVVSRRNSTLADRFFGPLARRGSLPEPEWSQLFADPSDRTTLSGDAEVSHSKIEFGVLRVAGGQTPSAISFATWNPESSRQFAWVTFMVSLTLGVYGRRLRSSLLRRAMSYVPIAIAAFCWHASEPFVQLAGGSLMGWGLALVLPRHIVARPTSTAAEVPDVDEQVTKSKVIIPDGMLTLAVAAAVVFGLDRVGQTQPTSDDQRSIVTGTDAGPIYDGLIPEQDGEAGSVAYLSTEARIRFELWKSARKTNAAWLIRGGHFNINVGEDAQIEALLDVAVRTDPGPTPLRLDFEGVTFESTESVEVDGETARIIPASQGDGILVIIAPSQPDESEGDQSEWSHHAVSVRCRAPIASNGDRRRLAFRIPIAASAALTVTSRDEKLRGLTLRTDDSGAKPLANSSIDFYLGGRNRIECDWWDGTAPELDRNSDGGSVESVATILDVTPLGCSGRTAIQLRPQTRPIDSLAIPIRPNLVIQEVDAPAELRWRVTSAGQSQTLELNSLEPIDEPTVIVVRTLQAVRAVDAPQPTMAIGPVVLLPNGPTQLVHFGCPSRFEIDVIGEDSNRPLTTAEAEKEWSNDQLAAPTGPIWRFTGGEPVTVRLTPQTTRRIASIDTKIALLANDLDWSATLSLDVEGAPVPLHRLNLDPGVNIERAAAFLDGADRLARFARRGESLDLVLSRPYSGPIRIELSGDLPLSQSDTTDLPKLQLIDAEIAATICSIQNLSDRDALLVSDLGTQTNLPAVTSDAQPDDVVFTDLSPDRPTQIQPAPAGDTVHAEVLTRFHRLKDQRDWRQRAMIAVHPESTPLPQVELVIPASVGADFEVSPKADVITRTELDDGSTSVTFHPERLRSGAYRIQLDAPLTPSGIDGVWTCEPLAITNVSGVKHWVQFDELFPWRPTSALGEAAESESIPSALRPPRRTRDIVTFAVNPTAEQWTWTPSRQSRVKTAVPLSESLLWADDDQGLMGTAVYTVATADPGQLHVKLQPHQSLSRVRVDGRPVELSPEGRLLSIPVPGNRLGVTVEVEWSEPLASGHDAGLQLPRLVEPSSRETVVVFCSNKTRDLASSDSRTAVLCLRMSGLLTAIEDRSDQVFPIDHPLLESVRNVDVVLDRQLASNQVEPALVAECEVLRRRWQRVRNLIAIESGPPGRSQAGAAISGATRWEAIAAGVSFKILPPGETNLVLQVQTGRSNDWLVPLALIATAGLVFAAQRSGLTRSTADWLARTPAANLLLLGSFWVAFLQPRVVGVVLLLAAISLVGRTRRETPPPADSAWIGPPR